MLRQTPQMLKKSGIKKWRRNELPGINRQNRLCWKTECWKATWRNWRERIGACTHCGQLNEYPALPTPLLPTPLSPIISFHIQADTSLFLSILVLKINFTYFSHNYDNYFMFRDVPECSGMFYLRPREYHIFDSRYTHGITASWTSHARMTAARIRRWKYVRIFPLLSR